MNDPPTSDEVWDWIAEQMETWRSARAAGRTVSAAELCSRFPGLVSMLAGCIAAAERLERAIGGERGAPDAPAPDPFLYSPGEVIDNRYVLDREVGRGGSAVLWRGHEVAGGAPVALKLPRGPHPDPDKDVGEMFRHETEVARVVSCRNVVPVYRYGRHGDVPYIAFGWVEGGSLADRLRRSGGKALPESDAWSIARQLAGALAHIHALGVVHRDIKPENVLIESGGRVFLTDFGIALVHERTAGASGLTCTAAYMAPEQGRGGRLEPTCDIYAFGIVFFQLLTGLPPPPPGAAPCLETDPVLAALPPDVRRVLLRCLRLFTSDRYRSGTELSGALNEVGPPPAPLPPSPLDQRPTPSPKASGAVAPAAPRSGSRPRDALPPEALPPRPAPAVRRWRAAFLLALIAALAAVGELILLGASRNRVPTGVVTAVLIGACLALGVAVVRPQRTALGYLLVACVGLVVAAVIGGAADSLLRSITDVLNIALRVP